MDRVSFPTCFGFVLVCVSLSASAVSAQTVASSAPAATPVNATAITGVYNGNYRCARGPVNRKLTLVAPGDGSLTGVFTFDLPANSRTRTASYTLSGTYDAATGKFRLDPVEWEPPAPLGYVMVGMDGSFNSSAEKVSGNITYATCTTFEATRDKAQSAALPHRPALAPAAPAARTAPANANLTSESPAAHPASAAPAAAAGSDAGIPFFFPSEGLLSLITILIASCTMSNCCYSFDSCAFKAARISMTPPGQLSYHG